MLITHHWHLLRVHSVQLLHLLSFLRIMFLLDARNHIRIQLIYILNISLLLHFQLDILLCFFFNQLLKIALVRSNLMLITLFHRIFLSSNRHDLFLQLFMLLILLLQLLFTTLYLLIQFLYLSLKPLINVLQLFDLFQTFFHLSLALLLLFFGLQAKQLVFFLWSVLV